MVRYISIKEERERELDEGFTKDKPKPESGYIIKRTKKKITGKGVVLGWLKTRKKGIVAKKAKTGLTRGQLKMRARKAQRTKKSRPSVMKKSIRKAKKTRALNV